MKKSNAAGNIALCGVLGALGVVALMAGEIIPLTSICSPVFVMFLMIPVIHECGKKMALGWYAAVAILGLLLTSANPEAAIIFLAFGYYPIVRRAFGRIRPKLLRIVCKLVFFNGSVCAVYAVLIFLFRLDAVLQQLQQTGKVILAATVILANACFFLVEAALDRFEVQYIVRLRGRLRRK